MHAHIFISGPGGGAKDFLGGVPLHSSGRTCPWGFVYLDVDRVGGPARVGRAAERLGSGKGKRERIDGDWVGEGFSRMGEGFSRVGSWPWQLCTF